MYGKNRYVEHAKKSRGLLQKNHGLEFRKFTLKFTDTFLQKIPSGVLQKIHGGTLQKIHGDLP